MKTISDNPSQSQSIPLLDSIEMDDGFLPTLARSSNWCVHSTFRRTINLISEDGNLITLATRENSLMPYAIIVCAQDFSPFANLVGQFVTIMPEEIVIGNALRIGLNGCIRSTQLQPIAIPACNEQFFENIQFLTELFQTRHAWGSFYPDPASSSAFDHALQEMLVLKTQAFAQAVQNKDVPSAIEHGRSLLGLGIGLTPSGDDYLVGFFAVMLADASKALAFQGIASAITDNAQNLTNIISATYVQSAAQQRFKTEIRQLVQAVAHTGKAEIETALDQLLSIGATSGSDITQGVVDAFLLYTHQRKIQ